MLITATAAVILAIASLWLVGRRNVLGKTVKKPLVLQIVTFFMTGFIFAGLGMNNALAAGAGGAAEAAGSGIGDAGVTVLAAALAVGLACIGSAIAVAASASAAIGAISENEKMFGKMLIFVGLAEGIALYGLIVAFIILFQ